MTLKRKLAFIACVLVGLSVGDAGRLRASPAEIELGKDRQLTDSVIIVSGDGTDYEQFTSSPGANENSNGKIVLPAMVTTGPYKGDLVDITQQSEPLYTDRVVGGFSTTPHSFFAMLLYQDTTGWKFAGCGSTLVSNCHVITAAHCVQDRDITISGIYVNAHSPYNGNSNYPFHFTNVASIKVPSNYNDFTNVADLAILRLSECVDTDKFPHAEPASPSDNISAGTDLSLFGFGRLAEDVGTASDTKQLQEVELPYMTNQQCTSCFGNKIRDGMFCAGYEEGGKDACQGDSGSGLLMVPNNYNTNTAASVRPKLVGVVSWGVGCARRGYPGVYAQVDYYFNWIQSNICGDSDLASSVTWCAATSSSNNNSNNDVQNNINNRNNVNNVSNLDKSESDGFPLQLRSNGCSKNQCGVCEGECTRDNQCRGGLQCFFRNDNRPWRSVPGCTGKGVQGRNYCYDPQASRAAGNNSVNVDIAQSSNRDSDVASANVGRINRNRRKKARNNHA